MDDSLFSDKPTKRNTCFNEKLRMESLVLLRLPLALPLSPSRSLSMCISDCAFLAVPSLVRLPDHAFRIALFFLCLPHCAFLIVHPLVCLLDCVFLIVSSRSGIGRSQH